MRKVRFSVLHFIGAICLALISGVVALAIAQFVGANAQQAVTAFSSVALGLLAYALVPWRAFVPERFYGSGKLALMAVQVEVWQNHIEGNLFKNNEFIKASTDASQYVLQGKVVHIPQAGGVPNVEKNRSVTGSPATVAQRTDTDVTYSLDVYNTDPTLIQGAEVIESSYNKRESVLVEHEAAINEEVVDNIMITWAPSLAACMVRTSGEDVAAHLTSGTGLRKRFTTGDLKNAQKVMNKQNIPMEGRNCVMSADMFSQLQDDMTATQYRDFSMYLDAKTGKVGKLFGFDIYVRKTVVTYTNAATPVVNAFGAAANADDNDAVLCWHQDKVERAIGSVKFLYKEQDPTYYGDVFSVEVRAGGRKRRTNEEGTVAIIQAAGGGN